MPERKLIRGQKIDPAKLQRAKELRHQGTPAEDVLWQQVRRSQLGAHFRRQQIIAGFIVDFYCHAAGLIIELDGSVHGNPAHRIDDARRDQVLSAMGLRIVRFKNSEVTADLGRVLREIRALIHDAPSS